MGLIGAGHGDCTGKVAQTVSCFILDWAPCRFLFHTGLEATTLHHEVVDYSMKDCAIIETVLHILNEVRTGLGGLLFIQLE